MVEYIITGYADREEYEVKYDDLDKILEYIIASDKNNESKVGLIKSVIEKEKLEEHKNGIREAVEYQMDNKCILIKNNTGINLNINTVKVPDDIDELMDAVTDRLNKYASTRNNLD